MYVAHSSKTLESTSSPQPRKPKEHHKLIKYVVFDGYVMIPGRTLIIIKQARIKPLTNACTCAHPPPTHTHTLNLMCMQGTGKVKIVTVLKHHTALPSEKELLIHTG